MNTVVDAAQSELNDSQPVETEVNNCSVSSEAEARDGDDVTSLMDRKGVNKRWLKSRSRSRDRGTAHQRAARVPTEPRDPPPRAPRARVTHESVDLGQCVRNRRDRSTTSGAQALGLILCEWWGRASVFARSGSALAPLAGHYRRE